MSKVKYVVTFGIGFLASVAICFIMSYLFLSDVTDSKLYIILNTIFIIVLTSLINIPVYLYIIKNKDE